MSQTNSVVIANRFREIQDSICSNLVKLDGQGRFREDLWSRDQGGGGRTRVITGKTIEKGGVNFSEVYGEVTEAMQKALLIEGNEFYATGVSIVLHPSSPMMPIIHMNIRYFEMDGGQVWWFGGGIDLTPHYVDKALAKSFHQRMKDVCDDHDHSFYDRFKAWADDYFYVRHRNETRGVGGIFFDHLGKDGTADKEELFGFVSDVGYAFYPAYEEQILATRDRSYTDRNMDWQYHRRGRYAEFNLVWDRGTKFGLHSGGRTESILMSLPPMAMWTYDHPIDNGSAEQETIALLKKDIDWLHIS